MHEKNHILRIMTMRKNVLDLPMYLSSILFSDDPNLKLLKTCFAPIFFDKRSRRLRDLIYRWTYVKS